MASDKKAEKKDEENDLYEVLPVTRQLVFMHLAQSCMGYFPDKIYYMIQAINQLKADIPQIDSDLRKEFPNFYPVLYNQYEKTALNIKRYYDTLKGDKIIKPDIDNPIFILYEREMAKLPLINLTMQNVFYFAFKKTKLITFSIPSTALGDARLKYKVFEPKDENEYREKKDYGDYDDNEDE